VPREIGDLGISISRMVYAKLFISVPLDESEDPHKPQVVNQRHLGTQGRGVWALSHTHISV
jgi:hypothetical protein